MIKIFIYSIFCFIVQTSYGQSKYDKELSINFSKCINKNIQEDFFRNKIVILEFWATWCAPCIAGFPHLNELSDKFASEEVIFASITKETDTSKVTTFLKRTPLKALNLIDNKGITFKNYDITVIPKTIVIGKDKSILWKGYYADLTAELLHSLISKGSQIIERGESNEKFTGKKIAKEEGQNYYLSVKLNHFQNYRPNWGDNLAITPQEDNYHFKCEGWSLCNLIGLQLMGYPPGKILHPNVKDVYVDIEFKVYENVFQDQSLFLLERLKDIFDLEVQKKIIDTIVWKPQIIDSAKLFAHVSNESKQSWAVSDDRFVFKNCSINVVTKAVEFNYSEIFISKTSIEGYYDMEIPNFKNFDQFNNYLKINYGLVFHKIKHAENFLFIESD